MVLTEINWLKENRHRVCKDLRSLIFNSFRPTSRMPCYIKNSINSLRHLRKNIPVILETTCCSPLEYTRIETKIGLKGSRSVDFLESINSYACILSINDIEKLLTEDVVNKIYLDREIRVVSNIATQALRANKAWSWGFTGEGQTIAVLDTGVYPHADLVRPNNRIIGFVDFIKGKTKPYDDNGHGTHVAGCAAGNGYSSQGKFKGTAPRSNIIGVKCLDKNGGGRLSYVIKGIEWCIREKEKYNIKIINMSLGAPANEGYEADPLCKAVSKAWEKGIVVCAAAGNEGPGKKTISTPGIHPRIITVGAINDKRTVNRDDDEIANFSSRGPTVDSLEKPDLLAPGVNITSLKAPYSSLAKEHKKQKQKDYISMSGTSMATPFVSGLAALMFQINPNLTPDQVKDALLKASDLLDYDSNTQGKGYIDGLKVINNLTNKK